MNINKKIIFVFLTGLIFFAFAPLYAEKKVDFIVQTGTSYTLSGYYEKERSSVGNLIIETTEYLPDFYMNQLQLAIGKEFQNSLYLGFMIGGWVKTDFTGYAVTNASLYGKYAFMDKNISPILTFQGGLFMENFPNSFLGFVINPAVGIELNRSSKLPIHITTGYLLTFFDFDGTDPGDATNITNDSEQRHGISLTAGCSF